MQRHIPNFLFLVALVTAFYIYRPGLYGSFIFDDGPNILQNHSLAISELSLESLRQAGFSSASGPLGRPISMASFAIDFYFHGVDPFYFKLTNLVIHLVNGIGIFALTLLLLRFYRRHFQPLLDPAHITWIGLAVATVWLVHPFNLTSVLYVVQRMTSLAAFFCIMGLTLFTWGRIRLYEGKSGLLAILASLIVFTPLAMLSKETGALLPLFMLVAEFTFFNFQCADKAMQRRIKVVFALAAGLPAAVAVIYATLNPQWLMTGYINRDFSLSERLMTEARVVFFYLQQIVLPSNSAMGIFHDDIPISRSLLQPFSTAPAVVGIVVLPLMAIVLRKQAPMLAFGVLFFLAGHILESTVFSLEIAHEHRNYLPMYGIVLVIFYYLQHPKYADTLMIRRVLTVVCIGLFCFLTQSRAQDWADSFELKTSEVRHHPDSARDNCELGSAYASLRTQDSASMENYYLAARYYYLNATELNQNYPNGLFGLVILNSTREKPIEKVWLDELIRRLGHAPFAADVSSYLEALVTCQMQGMCKLSVQDFNKLFEASLGNPTLTGYNRASVFSAQSYYLVNIARDYKAGLTAMDNMVDFAPEVLENRMTRIKFLLALQRYTEAKEQLE